MKKKDKKKNRIVQLVEKIKEDKIAFAVYAILRLIVIIVLVRSIFLREWESVYVCALTLTLLLLPPFVEKQLNLELPTALEVTAFVFVFCAEILGELGAYYVKVPFWDAALHTTSGFIFAAFGFCLLDLLNRNKKVNLTPLTLTLVAFCFSMTVGVVWEFFEFSADFFFNTDMQKDTVVNGLYTVLLDPTLENEVVSIENIVKTTLETADGQSIVINGYIDIGIADTMKDLFVNFIGAVVFCIFGYIYVTKRGKRASRIVAGFVPKVVSSDEKESLD
ncbi:MAG: hypothetical protein IJD67_04460, partial [Clostridia bacterium]|nr:hypothetical protein [Clostridia bacterium]